MQTEARTGICNLCSRLKWAMDSILRHIATRARWPGWQSGEVQGGRLLGVARDAGLGDHMSAWCVCLRSPTRAPLSCATPMPAIPGESGNRAFRRAEETFTSRRWCAQLRTMLRAWPCCDTRPTVVLRMAMFGVATGFGPSLVPLARCRLPGLGRARAGGDDHSCKPKCDEGTRATTASIARQASSLFWRVLLQIHLRDLVHACPLARCAACARPGPPIRSARLLSAGGQAMTCGHMLDVLFTCLSHAKRHARRGRGRESAAAVQCTCSSTCVASELCLLQSARTQAARELGAIYLPATTNLVSTSACPRLTSPSISPRDPRQRDSIERGIGTFRASSHLICL